MQTVAEWLSELGLSEYADDFAGNEIDFSVLPSLTAQDLEDIGVRTVGARRKLLNAIADLAGNAADAAAPRTAERRQVTVVFFDLVGSTRLSASLDPEDMRDVLHSYQNSVAGEIARFGGHLAKFMGDGVLSYFGYPRAYEDSAERAARTSLAVVEAVSGLTCPNGKALAVRVGIATGTVVAGDLIGDGAAQEEAVVGDALNHAARLQGIAEPNTVFLTASTLRLLGNRFNVDFVGERPLKGVGEAVPVYRLRSERSLQSRFEAVHGVHLTPFIGRDREIELILDRWAMATQGMGQVVLLSGEPGIGKSRITLTVGERINEPYLQLFHQCSAHEQNSAFYPVIDQIERASGFSEGDTSEQRLAKLNAFAKVPPELADQVVPFIAALLSVQVDGPGTPELPPKKLRDHILSALCVLIEARSARAPILLIFEDVHWVDPSTLEFIEDIVFQACDLRVLVIITFRTEFAPRWKDLDHVTTVELARLESDVCSRVLEMIAGADALPRKIRDEIVAKTDGNPLFIEELTKSIVDLDCGAKPHVTALPNSLKVPGTLQDSLMARLDRLAPVRELAQIGAVIGREFSHDLLSAVAPTNHVPLSKRMAKLVESGLVFRRDATAGPIYTFKHALVQDAAYNSLLKSRRRDLHARIAEAIQQLQPEINQIRPELIAYHYSEAALLEKAAEYWLVAGELAVARSSNKEAISHLRNGLEVVGQMPKSRERKFREIDLQLALGPPLIATLGYAAPETSETYKTAGELCKDLGDVGRLLPVLHGQWSAAVVSADHRGALQTANEFLELAEQERNREAVLVGHRAVGFTQFMRANFLEAKQHLETVLQCYDENRDHSLGFRYGQDPKSIALANLSMVLCCMGYPDQGRNLVQDGMKWGRQLDHKNTLAHMSLYHGCFVPHFLDERRQVFDGATSLIALSAENDFSLWHAFGRIFRGWAVRIGDSGNAAENEMVLGLEEFRATGAKIFQPCFLTMLARVHSELGAFEQGLATLNEAVELSETFDERWYDPEIYRLKGEITMRASKSAHTEAESSFVEAIRLAKDQNAKGWELRAATSLAQLWFDQGRIEKAHELLAPVYARFTEGFSTPDLVAARSLLDKINSQTGRTAR